MPPDQSGGASDHGLAAAAVSTGFANTNRPPQRGCRVGDPGARRGKTCRRHLLLNAMALGPGLVLAEVAGSMFCPLSPSRRLRLFAPPALPAAAARQMARGRRHAWRFHAHLAPRNVHKLGGHTCCREPSRATRITA